MLTQQDTEARTLLEKEQQLLSALLAIRNPQQRLATIVDRARHRAALDAVHRTEANRVPGCLVRTWFTAEFRAGKCWFSADSDAVMLKALLGMVCDLYSGSTPTELADASPDFLQQLGVVHQLAENRQRTVLRVAAQMRDFAQEQLRLAA